MCKKLFPVYLQKGRCTHQHTQKRLHTATERGRNLIWAREIALKPNIYCNDRKIVWFPEWNILWRPVNWYDSWEWRNGLVRFPFSTNNEPKLLIFRECFMRLWSPGWQRFSLRNFPADGLQISWIVYEKIIRRSCLNAICLFTNISQRVIIFRRFCIFN